MKHREERGRKEGEKGSDGIGREDKEGGRGETEGVKGVR
jgi:hypothetical protein